MSTFRPYKGGKCSRANGTTARTSPPSGRAPASRSPPSWSTRSRIEVRPTPGVQGVRRYSRDGQWIGDMVYDVDAPPVEDAPPEEVITMVDPEDVTRRKTFGREDSFEELLVPVFRNGEAVYEAPPIAADGSPISSRWASFAKSNVTTTTSHVPV